MKSYERKLQGIGFFKVLAMIALVIGVAGLLPQAAQGQSTWKTLTSTTNWNNSANWDSAPASNNANTVLIFTNSSSGSAYGASNDFSSFVLNQINFTNATTTNKITLLGNALTFTNTTGGTAPTINQGGVGAVAINNPLALSNSITVSGAGAGTLTMAGLVSGAGALTMAGSGSLALSVSNSLAGGVTLSSGTLTLGHNASLGTNALTISGGKMDVTSALALSTKNAQTWNANWEFLGANTLNMGTNTVTLGNNVTVTASASTLTVGGKVTGSSYNLAKMGAGVLVLTNLNNNFKAGTIIGNGVLSVAGTGALPDWNAAYSAGTAGYIVSNGAGLAVGNAVTDDNIVTILGTDNFLAGASIGFDTTAGNRNYASNIVDTAKGALGLVKAGANTLVLSGAGNTYSGGTIIEGGTLNVTNDILGVAGSPLTIGYVGNAGTYQVSGTFTNNGRAITLGAGGIRVDSGNTFTITNAVNGSAGGGLTKSGPGTLVFSGNTVNGGNGVFTNSGGTLILNNAVATNFTGYPLITGASFVVTNGGRWTAGSMTIGSGSTLTVTGTNSAYTSDPTTFSGPNNWIVVTEGASFSGGNMQMNGAYYNNSTIVVSNGASLTATKIYLSPNGVPTYTQVNDVLIIGGTNLNTGAAATVNAPVVIGVAACTGGDAVYLNAGGLLNGSVTIGYPNGAIYLNGGTLQSALISGPGTNYIQAGGAVFNNGSGNTVVSNTIADAATVTGNLTKGGTGKLILLGANTYSGTTAINAGTLVQSNSLALQNSTLNVGASGTNQFGGNNTAYTLGGLAGSGNLALTNLAGAAVTLTVGNYNVSSTYGGILSGTSSSSLVKVGTGTLTLNGANTYSGGTTVSNGTLAVNGSLAGAITVTASGTLGGTGTVVVSSLTMSPGASLQATITETNGQSAYLTLNSGTLDIGSLKLNVVNTNKLTKGYVYKVFQGAWSNEFTSSNLPTDWKVDYTHSGYIQVRPKSLSGTLLMFK